MKGTSIIFILVLTSMANIFTQTEADFNVTLTDDNTGVVITKYIGKATDVKIPAAIQGMPVKEIGKNAFNSSEITNIVIPEGVVKIQNGSTMGIMAMDGAFMSCTSLVSVTLPSTLTEIGNCAFIYCMSLRSITIPKNVTEIGDIAFSYSGLTSIKLPDNLKIIREGTFSTCYELTSVIIPEGITEIQQFAFSRCTSLISVALPSTITTIGAYAFNDCTALTTITIPELVKNIQFVPAYGVTNESFKGTGLTLANQAALRRRGYTGDF